MAFFFFLTFLKISSGLDTILLFKQQSLTLLQSQTPISLWSKWMTLAGKMHTAAFAHNTRSGIFNSPMDQWLRMPPLESKLSSEEQAVFLNLGGRRIERENYQQRFTMKMISYQHFLNASALNKTICRSEKFSWPQCSRRCSKNNRRCWMLKHTFLKLSVC